MKSARKMLEQELSQRPHVSVHPHRFGGKEFRFGRAEIGHVHSGGIVDIPFPRPIRDALLADELAEEHHWVPNSGWVTYSICGQEGLQRALWLLRLSYLRYALKADANPRRLLAQESQQLHLTPRFISLLEPFVSFAVADAA